MLDNYNIQNEKGGRKVAADWLNKRIDWLERKCYGTGFSQRVRGYMREYDDAPKIERASDRKRGEE
jgi:hypothetical protein